MQRPLSARLAKTSKGNLMLKELTKTIAITDQKGRTFHEDLIPVAKLQVVWPESQQPFYKKHADSIIKSFNYDLIGVIIACGPFKDGRYHIIDGQHRVAAVTQIYGPTETVPCHVYHDLTKQQAAQLFHDLNSKRRRPAALDLFRTAVTSGQQPEMNINKTVQEIGFTVGRGANGITAVESLRYVYRLGGTDGRGLLLGTLLAIRETWGLDNEEAREAAIIQAFGSFLHAHPTADRKRLYANMSKRYTASRFLAAVKTASESLMTNRSQAGRELISRIYNAGLRQQNKLV